MTFQRRAVGHQRCLRRRRRWPRAAWRSAAAPAAWSDRGHPFGATPARSSAAAAARRGRTPVRQQRDPVGRSTLHHRERQHRHRLSDRRHDESLDNVWAHQLTGGLHQHPDRHLLRLDRHRRAATPTSVGPFYCPADPTAYFDTSFFTTLVDQFGSSGGPLAQEYVVAHEFGHHMQNQMGTMARRRSSDRGATSGRCASSCRPTATPASGPSTPTRDRTRCSNR